nr:hypothetical protein [Nitriliruptor alkaliphilus]
MYETWLDQLTATHRPADLLSSLDHGDVESRFRERHGRDQPLVPGADDHHVRRWHGRSSERARR